MKNYRYYLKATDKNGTIIFDHRSDSAVRLFKLYKKASTSPSGKIFSAFFYASLDTNINARAWHMAMCGEEI